MFEREKFFILPFLLYCAETGTGTSDTPIFQTLFLVGGYFPGLL